MVGGRGGGIPVAGKVVVRRRAEVGDGGGGDDFEVGRLGRLARVLERGFYEVSCFGVMHESGCVWSWQRKAGV